MRIDYALDTQPSRSNSTREVGHPSFMARDSWTCRDMKESEKGRQHGGLTQAQRAPRAKFRLWLYTVRKNPEVAARLAFRDPDCVPSRLPEHPGLQDRLLPPARPPQNAPLGAASNGQPLHCSNYSDCSGLFMRQSLLSADVRLWIIGPPTPRPPCGSTGTRCPGRRAPLRVLQPAASLSAPSLSQGSRLGLSLLRVECYPLSLKPWAGSPGWKA